MSQIFELKEVLEKISRERRYREFLRADSMSAGVYVLATGASDVQLPHKEDEIYYVARGTAKLRGGGTVRAISDANVIFVERGLDHRFFDIEEELVLLVVFAPAESKS
jgi:mannose-6-phosphate isomerase-like protein (cupin superfamily)